MTALLVVVMKISIRPHCCGSVVATLWRSWRNLGELAEQAQVLGLDSLTGANSQFVAQQDSQPFVRGERLRDIASGREGAHQQQVTGLPERGHLHQFVTGTLRARSIPHLRAPGKLPHSTPARGYAVGEAATPDLSPWCLRLGQKRPPGDKQCAEAGRPGALPVTHSDRGLGGMQLRQGHFDIDRGRFWESQAQFGTPAKHISTDHSPGFGDQSTECTTSIGWSGITPQCVQHRVPVRRAATERLRGSRRAADPAVREGGGAIRRPASSTANAPHSWTLADSSILVCSLADQGD